MARSIPKDPPVPRVASVAKDAATGGAFGPSTEFFLGCVLLAAWVSATAAGTCWIRSSDLWGREAAAAWGRAALAAWWLAGLGLSAAVAGSANGSRSWVAGAFWLAGTPLVVLLAEGLAVGAMLDAWHPYVWWAGPAGCCLGAWWWRRLRRGCVRIWPVRFGTAEVLAGAATVALATSFLVRVWPVGY